MDGFDMGSQEMPVLGARRKNQGLFQRLGYYWNKFDRLNASWTKKWWYSTVHNITAIVGAGVLALPYSMAYLTWSPGITAIILLWILSFVTFWQMTEMHERKELDGFVKFDRFHELGQYLFGPKLGIWLVIPCQLLVEVGVDIVYSITAGKSIRYIAELNGCHISIRRAVLIFSSAQFIICQMKDISSITWISIVAAITAVCYPTITWSIVLAQKESQSAADRFDYPKTTTANAVFHVFASLGQIAFALSGHNVVLEIQATIPSTEQKPSKEPMWRGAILAYIIIALCYLPTAIICYWVYGSHLVTKNLSIKDDNMLLILKHPKWLVTIANAMLVLHMVGGYQIYAMPFFDKIEGFIEQKFYGKSTVGIPVIVRVVIRLLYVGITSFVAAVAESFFSDLQGLIGGIAYIPSTFVLPCLMWQFFRKPKLFSLQWIGNLTMLVVGILIMIVSTVGGLRNVIEKA